jgi:hypothetical protein
LFLHNKPRKDAAHSSTRTKKTGGPAWDRAVKNLVSTVAKQGKRKRAVNERKTRKSNERKMTKSTNRQKSQQFLSKKKCGENYKEVDRVEVLPAAPPAPDAEAAE